MRTILPTAATDAPFLAATGCTAGGTPAKADSPLMVQQGRLAVVAPFGGGAEFVRALPSTWDCVAVTLPSRHLPTMYRYAFDPRSYQDVVHHVGDIDRTVERLRALRITAVSAGTEFGAPLADQLAAGLGLPGNRPASSHLRHDKGAMVEAVRSAGLAFPATLLTGNVHEAIRFASASEAAPQEWIIKPAGSVGADGVRLCRSPDEMRVAWTELLGTATVLGQPIDQLIVQERLVGWQYAVNSVSLRSTGHKITEVWSDRRAPGHLHDRLDLLEQDLPLPQLVADYADRVLDALDFRHGPAHTEVMVTPDRGPILIETGARTDDGYDRPGMVLTTGSDHVADTVLAMTTGLLPPRPQVTSNRVCTVYLNSPVIGDISPMGADALRRLPTLVGHSDGITAGAPVRRTVNRATSPGQVLLASGSARAIERDYLALRQIEQYLYRSSNMPAAPR